MGTRLDNLHADVLLLADPETLGRWEKFKRKIGKTIYAAYDHKKAAVGWAVAGVAASIALGVATGGASLLIQFAVGTAYALTKKAAGDVMDYASYKSNKKKLESLKTADPTKIGRKDLRAAKGALDYNEEHLKTAIHKSTQAFLKLSSWKDACASIRACSDPLVDQTSVVTLSRAQAQSLLTDMYHFYYEYDRALHYFSQFEVFVEFSRAFVAEQANYYNNRVVHWDRAIEESVHRTTNEHKAICRKSWRPGKTDICYGSRDDIQADRINMESGTPYHRVID